MGHYTKFHFRAKLDFKTPESVRQVLRDQFNKHGDWCGSATQDHPFFSLPRACMIPWSNNFDASVTQPQLREYPDGSLILEFTCEFKNYDDEIEQFLDWIKPFVRSRYGKRNRGRDKIWVGYLRPESADNRSNVYIKPAPRPGCFDGNLFDREVIIDWRS